MKEEKEKSSTRKIIGEDLKDSEEKEKSELQSKIENIVGKGIDFLSVDPEEFKGKKRKDKK